MLKSSPVKALFTFYVLLFIASAPMRAQEYYFPERGADWQRAAPGDYGIDAARLQEAVDFAVANEYPGPRDLRIAILRGFEREPFHQILGPTKKRGGPAGMILKKGYLLASWGDTRRVDMTFSVTKSYLSTTAGLALQEGLIGSVEDSVQHYVWDGKFTGAHNSGISWEHLLNQSSDWSGTLWGGHDWADRPPAEGGLDDWQFRELNPPGSVFEYNDVRVNLLAYSLLQVWRKPLPQVLKERIMDPIGASTTWRWYGYDNSWVDLDGRQMQSVSGGGHSGGGMFISTEDQARFGLLMLNEGKWGDQQLLDPDWIVQATQPSTANPNYGYMWWLNQPGERHLEGVPESVYFAAGFGGNFILIIPGKQVVAVTRWLDPQKMGEFVQMLMGAL